MKTVTITLPLQSRLLNSALVISWMSISNFQGAPGHRVCRENHFSILSWRVLQTNRSYSSFGECDSSYWGSVFFLVLQLCLKCQYFSPAFLKLGSFFTFQHSLGMHSCDVDSSSSILNAEYNKSMFHWCTVPKSELPSNIMERVAICELFSFPKFHTFCTYLQRYQSQQQHVNVPFQHFDSC